MCDGSRIFHASFIKLITNTSALCFFLPYATTSPTTLANMQAFFPLDDPMNHNHTSCHKKSSNFFPMCKFSLLNPEVFNSSWFPESSCALIVFTVHDYFFPEHFRHSAPTSAGSVDLPVKGYFNLLSHIDSLGS
jgi:hypothetical protein